MSEHPALTAALQQLAEANQKIVDLQLAVKKLSDDDDKSTYSVFPAIRWWDLTDEEREAEKHQIRGWVEQMLPLYGHLGPLPECWEQHDLALMTLDWVVQLWLYFHISEKRSPRMIGETAEFQLRLLPGALRQIATDCKDCTHAMEKYRERVGR